MQEGYPGATPHLDWRQGFPKPIYEYYVTLLPQTDVQHKVHLWDGRSLDIPPPPQSKTFPAQQPSQPATEATEKNDFGPTTRGPLGWIVHARSGDKGSNCNVGFWVRHKDEWDWLRSLLSVTMIERLLADEYKGKKIVSTILQPTAHEGQPPDDTRTASSCRTCTLSTSFCTITWTEE